MQYLVFGTLLILGAVVMGLYIYLFHAKNRIEAVVLESYCDIKQKEKQFESITVRHMLEIDLMGEKRKIETELIPVRELSGAKISLFYDIKNEKVYVPNFEKYLSLLSAFFLSGLVIFAVRFLSEDGLNCLQEIGEISWLVILLGAIAVVTLSQGMKIINPVVLKTKGKFEGIVKASEESCDAEVYSLWYGEHRQYAKRTKGMLLKQKAGKTVTLFYNTKTGHVYRWHEVVISIGISVLAFLSMVVLLLVR